VLLRIAARARPLSGIIACRNIAVSVNTPPSVACTVGTRFVSPPGAILDSLFNVFLSHVFQQGCQKGEGQEDVFETVDRMKDKAEAVEAEAT